MGAISLSQSVSKKPLARGTQPTPGSTWDQEEDRPEGYESPKQQKWTQKAVPPTGGDCLNLHRLLSRKFNLTRKTRNATVVPSEGEDFWGDNALFCTPLLGWGKMPGSAHLQQTGVMSRGRVAGTFREDLVDTEITFSCCPTSTIHLPLCIISWPFLDRK